MATTSRHARVASLTRFCRWIFSKVIVRKPLRQLPEGICFLVLREAFTCDHSRSIDFMTHLLSPELKDGCTPIAYKCSSWRAFESGHCFSCGKHGENCIIMGAEAKIVPSLPRMGYYSKTTEHSPYCGKSLACADVVFLTDISKAHQFRVEMSLLSDCPNSRIYITVLDSKANRVHGFTRYVTRSSS